MEKQEHYERVFYKDNMTKRTADDREYYDEESMEAVRRKCQKTIQLRNYEF